MQIKSSSILFIILWNIASVLENPKYITVASKRPVKDVWSRSGVTQNGVELLQNGRDLTTKWEQPWPQLVRCASIYCRICGCVFQED